MPEIINISSLDASKDAKMARFHKNHFEAIIGTSTFEGISIPGQKEALALGVALRAKYIFLIKETLNKYVTLDGYKLQKEVVYAFFAIGAERDEGYDFAPCTRLIKEYEELYGSNASKRK